MTYLLVSLPFITLAVVVGGITLRTALGRDTRAVRRHLLATAIAFGVLAVLTAVFDSLMIASDLFSFGREHLIGLFVGLAPIEDFAYPLVTVLLCPPLWVWLRARRTPADRPEAP